MKHIECASLVPGCTFHTEARSEEDLIRKVVEHARNVHGIDRFTPALMDKVRAAMTEGRPG